MRGELYQIVLITLGVVVTALFGAFLYRELFPEYKIYQEDYVELEKFRSSYSGETPPPFQPGIKQIVIERKDKGPAQVERCTSCHVALEFAHFSPTKITYDINGNMKTGPDGFPLLEPNENYVWAKLDKKIQYLCDREVNNKLQSEGKNSEVKNRLEEAKRLQSLKTAKVGDHCYDVTKVLAMHPLIGRETRPFEYHPVEEYGCISCHSGNERGLTTEKAHGPVFDGKYEEEFLGPVPQFLEEDPQNDPKFSKIFNHKPGHNLLFQTTPILVGSLIQAKCVQCHNPTERQLESAYTLAAMSTQQRKEKHDAIIESYDNEVKALITLLSLKNAIASQGVEKTMAQLEKEANDYRLPPKEREEKSSQLSFLRKQTTTPEKGEEEIDKKLVAILGSKEMVDKLVEMINSTKQSPEAAIAAFVEKNRSENKTKGSLFAKADAVNLEKALIQHVKDSESSLKKTVSDKEAISAMITDIDLLTKSYQRGKELYLAQACYACHRIATFARGGVGPELTEEGEKYPWFIKESMVWPQADLKTSTMPNFHLDHHELEPLMTFLLAQKGRKKNESETVHKIAIQEWEAGKKAAWEEPISPAKMHDLKYGMEIFATEGCAACHRLKGYQSNVGFAIEKEGDKNYDALLAEKTWFQNLFPEDIAGSAIVAAIEENSDEIDKRIVDDVRKGAILEAIKEKSPDIIESYYSNFRYASRAKNHLENSEETAAWKKRVDRILMLYIEEYGLGRLIGPRPNWAGVYRTDEWLMEHFKNPSAHVARSIMPKMPFDTTKFYALTYMLDQLAIENRDALRREWNARGFNPKEVYDTLCSQCHGDFLQGNGPVSAWIYPIPKSLRNADFLRNLTKEKVLESILHGVKGTPMPPWGEVGGDKPMKEKTPILTEGEASQLVDWIYSSLPGGTVIRSSQEVPKWQYTPKKVVEELEKEGSILRAKPESEKKATQPPELSALPTGNDYYAANNPIVYSDDKVSQYFEIRPLSIGGREEKGYYIKEKYYSDENLAAGRAFFELNCAVCHGREGDGSGSRAGIMVDAKPRMLTNLDWLDTRDDLRLLQSIKYGVTGTSMTPWGDQTSSLQRMQLVMHIRELSKEAKQRSILLEALYKSFNEAEITVEQRRIETYPMLAATKNELEAAIKIKEDLQRKALRGEASTEEAAAAYNKQLLLEKKMSDLEAEDKTLQNLVENIARERQMLLSLGLSLIAQKENSYTIDRFVDIIKLDQSPFSIEQGALRIKNGPEEMVNRLKNQLIESIENEIKNLTHEKELERGKIRSPQTIEEITKISADISAKESLRNDILSTFEEIKRARREQNLLLEKYKEREGKEAA